MRALLRTLLVALVIGFASTAAAQSVVGMAIQDEPASLDPVQTIQLTAYQVLNYIMEPLVYIGPDAQPHGWVAESWTVSDDGTVIDFVIREGRTFHDGTPLDAEAVAFSFNRHLDPDVASANRTGLGTLETVEATGPNTVRFTYSAPYAPVWTSLASPFFGIVSPTAVTELGEDFGRAVVASGPFMLERWTPASGFDLVKTPGYSSPRIDVENQGEMMIDRLEVRILAEEGTRVAALETGVIHYGDAPRGEIDRLSDDPRFSVVINEQNNSFTMLEVNPFLPPMDDIRVRKAVAYALEVDDIAFVSYDGFVTTNRTPVPLGNTGYREHIAEQYGYQQDLERSAELLREAGYEQNAQGVWSKDGQPLTLIFWTYTLPNGMRGGQMAQQQLLDAGFAVDFQTFEVASMIGQLHERRHHLNYMWWSGWDPIFLSYVFRTPGWAGGYQNEELDPILDRAATELDPVARQAIVEEAQIFLLEDVGVIPVGTDWGVLLTRSDLVGLKLDALGFVLLNDAYLDN
jgi:peptide/nickel transport system substrate-binding protein